MRLPVVNKEFVRLLTKTTIEHALEPSLKFNDDAFKSNLPLLKHFIDDNAEFSLECLFAVQTLIDQLEYPSGKASNQRYSIATVIYK